MQRIALLFCACLTCGCAPIKTVEVHVHAAYYTPLPLVVSVGTKIEADTAGRQHAVRPR